MSGCIESLYSTTVSPTEMNIHAFHNFYPLLCSTNRIYTGERLSRGVAGWKIISGTGRSRKDD
jgi:hypothetical protein